MNLAIGLAILGIIASLIGIPIGYLIARRSLQLPDPRFAVDFDAILKPSDWLLSRGLVMTVDDHSIKSISRSRVAVWNHRGMPIREQDTVPSSPLRIQLPEGGTVLQVRTLSVSQPEIGLSPIINSTDEASVDIAFDFLNAGDGAIFEVVHEGTERPTVKGVIKGAKIRDFGSVRLDPEAIEGIRKSRIRRYFDYSSKNEMMGLAVTILVAFTFALLALGSSSSQPGHLINTNGYNLKTIAGQSEFAQAVQGSEPYSTDTSIALTAVFSIGAIYAVTTAARSFLTKTKRVVPKSIVAEIVSDETEGSIVNIATPGQLAGPEA